MGERLPRIAATEAIRALQRVGFRQVRQKGSHVQLQHDDRPGIVTVPVHAGEILYPKLLKSILVQAGLSVDEFRDLLG